MRLNKYRWACCRMYFIADIFGVINVDDLLYIYMNFLEHKIF